MENFTMSNRGSGLGMELPAAILPRTTVKTANPLRILILTPFVEIGLWVCARLEESGHVVTMERGDSEEFRLYRNSQVGFRDLQEVFNCIRPFIPPTIDSNNVPDPYHDVRIELCRSSGVQLNCRIISDSLGKTRELEQVIRSVSQGNLNTESSFIEKNILEISPDLDPINYAIAMWIAESHLPGFQMEVQGHLVNDEMVIVKATDHRLRLLPLKSRYPVVIESDDPDSAKEMFEWLQSEGFLPLINDTFEIDEDSPPRIEVVNGPFRGIDGCALAESITSKLRAMADARCIDKSRYPIRVEPRICDSGHLLITMPMNACRNLSRAPWAGPYPERFNVRIYSDQPDGPVFTQLHQGLIEIGFAKFDIKKIEPLTTVSKNDLFDYPPKLVLVGDFDNEHKIKSDVLKLIESSYSNVPGSDKFSTRFRKVWNDEDFDIIIYVPVEGISDGSALRRLEDPTNFDLTISGSDLKVWEPFIEELRNRGFDPKLNTGRNRGEASIYYGAASDSMIHSIVDLARSMAGVELPPNLCWSHTDTDIGIYLPDPARPVSPVSNASGIHADDDGDNDESDIEIDDGIDEENESVDQPARAGRPFVSLEGETLLVGQTRLRVRQGPAGPFNRPVSSMAHYCLDSITAGTLSHLAKSVALKEPCLLEGETSTSKTSSIEFLAAHLNQPVVRINLNGQTDTGDLVGRFIPQNLVEDLPLSIEELLRHEELLETESRIILRQAAENARNLTAVEIQQVMANEKMRTHPWRWQDGGIVQAMRHGYWVILDEVNLAEPQILERLNSLLEFQPSFVLSEFDNSRFGKGGTDIHPNFRIFATMNPAEYAGRSAMSPAYKDRWRGYRLMETVREQGYLAMLKRLVFGEQPEVELDGLVYDGALSSAIYPNAGAIPKMSEFLDGLARFHCSMESAAGQGGGPARIGARRKEKLVFTRRGLVSVIEFMDREAASGNCHLRKLAAEALFRYYLCKVPPGEDLVAANGLMDACGIGASSWSI